MNSLAGADRSRRQESVGGGVGELAGFPRKLGTDKRQKQGGPGAPLVTRPILKRALRADRVTGTARRRFQDDESSSAAALLSLPEQTHPAC